MAAHSRSRAVRSPCSAALAGLTLLAASCVRTPAPEPVPATRPAETPAAAGTPGTPRAAEPAAPVRRGELAYAPGTFVYDVTSEASIELMRDSTFLRAAPLVDTLTTAVALSYQIGGEGTDRLVTGTIDSFTVRSTGLVPGARAPQVGPIPFQATLLAGRLPARFTTQPASPAPPDSTCAAPDTPALALVRDVLVPLPLSAAPGQGWEDTVTTTVCRATIPVMTRAVRSYRVIGPATHDGEPALAVSRATRITMTGQGTPRGQTVTVLGAGHGAGSLYLDAAGTRYLGGVDSSTVELTISNGTQTRRFLQQSRQETRLRRE